MTNPLIVDLSHWNSEDLPDFTKDNVVGVVHKATQGLTYTDPNYFARATATKAVGLLWGAYHFGTGDNGIAQADHFINILAASNVDMTKTLVALDLESNPNGPSMLLAQAEAFVEHIKFVFGRLPVLYTGAWYLKEIMSTNYTGILTACALWIASYEDTPVLPPQWSTWIIQQYTDGQSGPQPQHLIGISADLDLDKFNGTADELNQWWGS